MERISITKNSESHYFKPEEIISIEAEGRYSNFILERKKPEETTLCMSLTELEEILPESFLRIHNSYIINMQNITHIKKRVIYMNNGGSYEIAQRRYNDVKQRINEYFGKNK